MASIYRDEKSGVFRILFRVGKKQFHKSLDTTDEKDAQASKGRIEDTLRAICFASAGTGICLRGS